MIRALIFDFNGVIADDETPHLRCFQQALAEHGLSLTKDDDYGTYLARIIHECRREAFETEARRGFSHVRPTEAYVQSVEETERKSPPGERIGTPPKGSGRRVGRRSRYS
jgi:beta-phosphoglucomutase-like phosphatase (HAD superfamily)